MGWNSSGEKGGWISGMEMIPGFLPFVIKYLALSPSYLSNTYGGFPTGTDVCQFPPPRLQHYLWEIMWEGSGLPGSVMKQCKHFSHIC